MSPASSPPALPGRAPLLARGASLPVSSKLPREDRTAGLTGGSWRPPGGSPQMWATAEPFTPGHQWVSAMSQGAPGRHPTEREFGASGRSAQPASSTVLRPPPGTKDDDVGPLGKRGLRLPLPWKQVLAPCSCPGPFPAHGGSPDPPVLCQTSLPRRPAGQGRALSLASSATRFALHTWTAEQGVGVSGR